MRMASASVGVMFGGDVLGLHGDLPGVGATRVGFDVVRKEKRS